MKFSGCGLKSHSGQLSIATYKNPSMVNPYVSIHSTTNKITCETSRKANVVTDEGKDQNGT